MTLNVNSLLCCQIYTCYEFVTKWLRLESRGFRHKVAIYLSYLHIKFDYKIKENHFEFEA